MPRTFALFALALLFACTAREPAPAPPPLADAATQRSLPAGDVIGAAGLHGGHAWLGLPFAQPPSGALRWRAPQPLAAWDGVRDALAFAPPCPQFTSPTGGVEGEPGTIVGSEDCLYLNVYAPSALPTADARLPVMVWIHGGGNTIGATSYYDGSALATNQNVIVVTVAYRLGALGWFRHASLRGDCGLIVPSMIVPAEVTPATVPATADSATTGATAAAEPRDLNCLDDNSGNFGTLD